KVLSFTFILKENLAFSFTLVRSILTVLNEKCILSCETEQNTWSLWKGQMEVRFCVFPCFSMRVGIRFPLFFCCSSFVFERRRRTPQILTNLGRMDLNHVARVRT